MKFHGRLTPGVLKDPKKVLELVVQSPENCPGVTIKIWELDTFKIKGKVKKEGTPDDLLAEFMGEIKDAQFKVKESRIVSEDPNLASFQLRVRGSEEVYTIPIVSEEGEAEGGSFELGFSMEAEGEEKFRTRSPCFFTPPTIIPRFIESAFTIGRDGKLDEKSAQEGTLAHQYAAVGTAKGKGKEARLKILGKGYVDAGGILMDQPRTEDKSPRPVSVRTGRPLYVYLATEPIEAEGETDIPIAACQPMGVDGQVKRRMPVAFDWSLARLAEFEVAVEEKDGQTFARYKPLEGKKVKSDFGKLAAEAQGWKQHAERYKKRSR